MIVPDAFSTYVGKELEIFAHATNWKRYLASEMRPLLAGDVLEVGGGIGATTAALCDGSQSSWLILEPDPALLEQVARRRLPSCCSTRPGTLTGLRPEDRFDAILYVDVLEHIEDDQGELRRAAGHLKPSGHLIVVSPALPFLFSEFDVAIGHRRRYTKAALESISPPHTTLLRRAYLDSCGMLASLANRVLLRRSDPSLRQILFWDRFLVPISRVIDPLHGRAIGRSLLSVWRAQPD